MYDLLELKQLNLFKQARSVACGDSLLMRLIFLFWAIINGFM